MKKQKVIILDNEQQNKSDLNAIHKLQKELNKFDHFPVYTPELNWFEQMVKQEQQNKKRKLIKDLFVFLFIAMFILSGIIISLDYRPIIFISLQILATVFIILYLGFRYIKKVNSI